MVDYTFENPTFDPDGPRIDDDYELTFNDLLHSPWTHCWMSSET